MSDIEDKTFAVTWRSDAAPAGFEERTLTAAYHRADQGFVTFKRADGAPVLTVRQELVENIEIRETADGHRLLDFGAALRALKAGKRVMRDSWTGRELLIVPGSRFAITADRPLGQAMPCLVDEEAGYREHIDQCTWWSGEATLGPWACGDEDVLAEDWVIMPGGEHVHMKAVGNAEYIGIAEAGD